MKTRLQKVMEAHEVNTGELLIKLIGSALNPTDEVIKARVVLTLKKDDVEISQLLEIRALRDICKICNCSADYLLGLTESMNTLGN